MPRPPIHFELSGWDILWVELRLIEFDADLLAAERREVAERVRSRHEIGQLASHPPIAAMRRLFKAAGCHPSRYRPSAEALLRRIVKGNPIPQILPFVDFGNCLSAELAVPVCVMNEGTFQPPFVLRSGLEGERYDSLRGPFKLDKKPLLVDREGPCDTPITGSVRVKVTPATEQAALVAYLPTEVVELAAAEECFAQLLDRVPIAEVVSD